MGPKTNEGATAVGERVGTRATAKYVRGSASKARQVLDLIRGLDVQRAEDILRLTEREMGATIRKVLASAVANAEHNDSQGRDELYVAACFADEGPTLRRFRPRARGRATRIRKRTCHLTIIVARLSEEELERKRRREEAQRPAGRRGRGAATTASRRARVAKSRQAAAEAEVVGTEAVDSEAVDTEAIETGEVEIDATETTEHEAIEDEAIEVEAEESEDEAEVAPDEAEPVEDEAEDAAEELAADEELRRTRTTRRTRPDGSEGQPLRLPPGCHHGLEVALVLRAGVQGLPHAGLEDPPLPDA